MQIHLQPPRLLVRRHTGPGWFRCLHGRLPPLQHLAPMHASWPACRPLHHDTRRTLRSLRRQAPPHKVAHRMRVGVRRRRPRAARAPRVRPLCTQQAVPAPRIPPRPVLPSCRRQRHALLSRCSPLFVLPHCLLSFFLPRCLRSLFCRTACFRSLAACFRFFAACLLVFFTRPTRAADVPAYCKRCDAIAGAPPETEVIAAANSECVSDCILGMYFSPSLPPPRGTGACTPCLSPAVCAAHTRYVPCTRRLNAYCDPCPALNPAHNTEYFTPPNARPACQTRCRAGFARDPTSQTCVECARACSVVATAGLAPAHLCLLESQRTRVPDCVACDDSITRKPLLHAAYTTGCEWRCKLGFYLASQLVASAYVYVCLPCQPCSMGAFPSLASAPTCTPEAPALSCTACTDAEIPRGAIPTSNVDPACPFVCPSGYYATLTENGQRNVCRPHWALAAFIPPDTQPTPPPPSHGGDTGSSPLFPRPPIIQVAAGIC